MSGPAFVLSTLDVLLWCLHFFCVNSSAAACNYCQNHPGVHQRSVDEAGFIYRAGFQVGLWTTFMIERDSHARQRNLAWHLFFFFFWGLDVFTLVISSGKIKIKTTNCDFLEKVFELGLRLNYQPSFSRKSHVVDHHLVLKEFGIKSIMSFCEFASPSSQKPPRNLDWHFGSGCFSPSLSASTRSSLDLCLILK